MIGLGLATKAEVEKAKYSKPNVRKAKGRHLGRLSVDELIAIYRLDENDLP